MSKVLVNLKVAEALKYEIQRLKDCTTLDMDGIYEQMLKSCSDSTFKGKAEALNNVGMFKLSKIFIFDYEIDMKPEEKLEFIASEFKVLEYDIKSCENMDENSKEQFLELLRPLRDKIQSFGY